MQNHETSFIPVVQHERRFYLCMLPAGLVVDISYAAIRGKHSEEGAVQRVLNSRRISSVKSFALRGGDFPNSIVLNWVNGELPIDIDLQKLRIPRLARAAQLIDGQHRVAGLEQAIEEDPEFRDFEVPVAIYSGLDTEQCAEIFLAINTEQKPVNKSLVFDLYGIVGDRLADPAIVRAQDIARSLSEPDAPYHGMIKWPGEQPRKGGVALSTVVTSIKPLIEKNGVLGQIGLHTLENQLKIFLNFFNALRSRYGSEWTDKSNALIYASGFSGALDFLSKRIVPYCVHNKSFSTESMSRAIGLDKDSLLRQAEVSGKGGTEAQRHVYSRLDENFVSDSDPEQFEF